MIFFNALNETFQVIFTALCAVAFVGQLFFLCLCISRKKNIIMILVTALVAVVSALNVTRLFYGAPIFSQSEFFSGDMAVIVVIAVNISLGTIAYILAFAEIHRDVLTDVKIPEYLENSKDGILFADRNGQVLFANYKIKELCRTITKSELRDANSFSDVVFKAKSNNKFTVFNVDGKLIFRFSENNAWEFSHTAFDGGNYIITATDATQSLNTAEKITENKRMIKETANRLQWTLDNLDGLKNQAEISEKSEPLRAQIRDYANRLYEGIANDGVITAEQVGAENIASEEQLSLIIRAFELIGVSVSVIGNMPSDEKRFTTLIELLFVSASSAVSLCRAERITMAIYEGGNKLTANINCDGTLLHSKHIGVFDNIKNRISALDGTLTITKEPSLKISVMLLK